MDSVLPLPDPRQRHPNFAKLMFATGLHSELSQTEISDAAACFDGTGLDLFCWHMVPLVSDALELDGTDEKVLLIVDFVWENLTEEESMMWLEASSELKTQLASGDACVLCRLLADRPADGLNYLEMGARQLIKNLDGIASLLAARNAAQKQERTMTPLTEATAAKVGAQISALQPPRFHTPSPASAVKSPYRFPEEEKAVEYSPVKLVDYEGDDGDSSEDEGTTPACQDIDQQKMRSENGHTAAKMPTNLELLWQTFAITDDDDLPPKAIVHPSEHTTTSDTPLLDAEFLRRFGSTL